MGDLLRPGSERAAGLLDDRAVLAAMVAVEDAWLSAMIGCGIAPEDARTSLASLLRDDDAADLAPQVEDSGNPVVPLVALLRERAGAANPRSAAWLHRGLTSQDVLDTALVLVARNVIDRLVVELRSQLARSVEFAEQHRATVMVARTLTQHAVPTTFGLKVASWLDGLRGATEELLRVRGGLAVQAGGAAGTRAAWFELARLAAAPGASAVPDLEAAFARGLQLEQAPPWHTGRGRFTALGDALVTLTDAYGHLANDVLLLVRPEMGELSLSAGGGSSTMPHKHNPVLPILVRGAALAAPALGAQLHLAAAQMVDERPDGAWHLEWEALRSLMLTCVVAASQVTQLLGTLNVHADRMRERVESATDQLLAERDGLRAALGAEPSTDRDPAGYLGASDQLVREICDRAASTLEELR